jgi:hypothetical protein
MYTRARSLWILKKISERTIETRLYCPFFEKWEVTAFPAKIEDYESTLPPALKEKFLDMNEI